MAENRSTSLMLLESVRNMVIKPIHVHAPGIVQGTAEVFIYEHGLIITSGLGLGLFFRKLPLPHGVMQLSVGIAYVLLPDKQLTVLTRASLEQWYLAKGLIIHEIDACHFRKLPNKLIKEPGRGLSGEQSRAFP
ncbi:hypothetical protein MDA_GLEAN10017494 [Myotis davidii]|uniref:Uncharacterized protein n=1 Tax=Myotis davidii TaxID=225400 RepID=L5LCD3_MYODS|nr:hypothetical protein MDA_GLEAN10017494 [Myotis davidii]